MTQLETTAWQYLRWPVALFATNGTFFFLFFYIQKEIVKDGALSRNLSTTYVVWLHSARPWEMIWFSHFTLTESHWCSWYSLSLYFIKNSFSISLCWPTDWQMKLSIKLLDRGRKIQNDIHTIHIIANQTSYHDDKSTFNTRFLPPTDQKCADCWTYWQFYYRPPALYRRVTRKYTHE